MGRNLCLKQKKWKKERGRKIKKKRKHSQWVIPIHSSTWYLLWLACMQACFFLDGPTHLTVQTSSMSDGLPYGFGFAPSGLLLACMCGLYWLLYSFLIVSLLENLSLIGNPIFVSNTILDDTFSFIYLVFLVQIILSSNPSNYSIGYYIGLATHVYMVLYLLSNDDLPCFI